MKNATGRQRQGKPASLREGDEHTVHEVGEIRFFNQIESFIFGIAHHFPRMGEESRYQARPVSELKSAM